MAIPLIIAGAVAAAASIAGGIYGEHLRGVEREKAEKLLRAASDEMGRIDLPKLKMLIAEQLPPSEFNKIKSDPDLRNAQMGALSKLREISDNGGATLSDRVAGAKLANRLGGAASAGFGRAEEEAAARGTFGGGTQLAIDLAHSQASKNAAADQEGELQARMEQRAMEAIMNRGRMSGDVRGQDFDEQSRVASANDEIARINAQYRDQTSRYNNQMLQQGYENEMNRAKGKYGIASDQANMYMRSGDQAAKNAQAIGNGVASAATMAGGAYANGAAPKTSLASSTQSLSLARQPHATEGGYADEFGDMTNEPPPYYLRKPTPTPADDDENVRMNRGYGGSY
jgi:hypothetical protein